MKYPTGKTRRLLSNTERAGDRRDIGIRAIVRLYSALLVCGLLFGVANGVFADTPEEFLEVLRRIAAAENETSYTGTRLIIFHTPRGLSVREDLVIQQPPELNAFKVLSVIGRERFDKDRKDDRFIGRDRRERRSGRSDRPSGRREFLPRRKRISNLSQEELELLTQNYQFHLSPGSTIAGQETDEIKIYPQFENRPTKRLFIARSNGIILRVDEFDYTGHIRFMSLFTEMEFDQDKVEETLAELKSDKELIYEKPERRSKPITAAEVDKALDVRLVQPTYLPSGFRLLETRYIKRRASTVFLRYSDGLATFSLFERKGKHKSHDSERRPRRRGGKTISRHDVPIHIVRQHHAHILEWSNSGVDFTLIGELDATELIKVAESVILANQKN